MKLIVNPAAPEIIQKTVGIIPEAFGASEAATLHQGRNIIKAVELAQGITAAVKRFGRPNWIQRIGRIGRPTKGECAYANSMALVERGISTPMPYAYLELGRGECYYACAFDLGGIPLTDMPQTEDNAQLLAEMFATLHRRGIIHKDLNNTNIRWCPDSEGGIAFTLIDTNRMRLYDQQPPMAECIVNTFRFSSCTPFFRNFLRRYMALMGWDGEELLQQWLASKAEHDARWARKKAFTRRLKRWLKLRK